MDVEHVHLQYSFYFAIWLALWPDRRLLELDHWRCARGWPCLLSLSLQSISLTLFAPSSISPLLFILPLDFDFIVHLLHHTKFVSSTYYANESMSEQLTQMSMEKAAMTKLDIWKSGAAFYSWVPNTTSSSLWTSFSSKRSINSSPIVVAPFAVSCLFGLLRQDADCHFFLFLAILGCCVDSY